MTNRIAHLFPPTQSGKPKKHTVSVGRDKNRRVTLEERVVKDDVAYWWVKGRAGRRTKIREDRLGSNRKRDYRRVP